MGLFDIFKKKEIVAPAQDTRNAPSDESLTNFECFYLYGLTDDPYKQSSDFKSFGELYKNVIGVKGGIMMGSSFHPYQLVNPKGTTVWHAGYFQLFVNNKKEQAFNSIINDNGVFLVNPPSDFSNIRVWPDTRLTYEENPVFSKYVPFVIPFLVYKSEPQTEWDFNIMVQMATKENASAYVDSITKLIRFFMPEPAFILGCDRFDETQPSKLIDNIVNCKSLLGH